MTDMMSLFLVKRYGHAGYDEASAFVVAAISEDQARALLSALRDVDDGDFTGYGRGMYSGDEGPEFWANPDNTSCEMIAEFSSYTEPTVVLRDFHHG